MSASRIEELLERLVEQNDEVLVVLHAIASNLDNVGTSIESFREEVNEKLETLERIEISVDALKDGVDGTMHVLESEIVWSKELSTAKMLLDRLDAIESKLGDIEGALPG